MATIKTKHFEMDLKNEADVKKLEKEIKEINRKKREFLDDLDKFRRIEFAEKHEEQYRNWLNNKDQVFIDNEGKITNN